MQVVLTIRCRSMTAWHQKSTVILSTLMLTMVLTMVLIGNAFNRERVKATTQKGRRCYRTVPLESIV